MNHLILYSSEIEYVLCKRHYSSLVKTSRNWLTNNGTQEHSPTKTEHHLFHINVNVFQGFYHRPINGLRTNFASNNSRLMQMLYSFT